MNTVGIIMNNDTRIARRSYRRGEFIEVTEAQAVTLTNSGAARYADGRSAAHRMVDRDNHDVRAFNVSDSTRKTIAKND